MINHQGQISISAKVPRWPVFISAVVSHSLACDATNVMDNDNLVTALEPQIQISIVLIGTVRKPSIDLIVLAKWWGSTPEKAQKIIQGTTQKGIKTMPPFVVKMIQNEWLQPSSSLTGTSCILRYNVCQCSVQKSNRCAQVYATDFRWARAFPMASKSEAHETLLLWLLGVVSHQHVFVTLPGKWYKVSLVRSSKRLHVTWNSWSHILPGQMLQKEK